MWTLDVAALQASALEVVLDFMEESTRFCVEEKGGGAEVQSTAPTLQQLSLFEESVAMWVEDQQNRWTSLASLLQDISSESGAQGGWHCFGILYIIDPQSEFQGRRLRSQTDIYFFLCPFFPQSCLAFVAPSLAGSSAS